MWQVTIPLRAVDNLFLYFLQMQPKSSCGHILASFRICTRFIKSFSVLHIAVAVSLFVSDLLLETRNLIINSR